MLPPQSTATPSAEGRSHQGEAVAAGHAEDAKEVVHGPGFIPKTVGRANSDLRIAAGIVSASVSEDRTSGLAYASGFDWIRPPTAKGTTNCAR